MAIERSLRTRVQQLAFRDEDVEGTKETLSAIDASDMKVEDLTWKASQSWEEDNSHRETTSRGTDTPGIRFSTLTFKTKMRGSGTAGQMPRWAQLLRACGYEATKKLANAYEEPVGRASNLSTGFTVDAAGTYTGTGNRVWLLKVTTAGVSGAAKLSITDLLGLGTAATNVTVTTASAINIATEGVTVTFTDAPTLSLALGDEWIVRIYDVATILLTPVTKPRAITSGLTATSGGTYTGTDDRLWYIYGSVAGALDGSHGKIAGVDLINGNTLAATFVSTGVAIDLGDGETFTLTAAAAELATTDAWTLRVAATGAKVYSPVPFKSLPALSMDNYKDGLLKSLSGARGTFTMDLAAGKPGIINFTFSGAYIEPTDADLLSGRTDRAIVPPPVLGARVKFGTWADAVCTQLGIDAGVPITQRTSMSADSGIISFDAADREPTIKADPQHVKIATKNFFSLMTTPTPEYITAQWGQKDNAGAFVAGNSFLIEAHTQYKDPAETDSEGRLRLDISGDLCYYGNAGDDEFRIWIQ